MDEKSVMQTRHREELSEIDRLIKEYRERADRTRNAQTIIECETVCETVRRMTIISHQRQSLLFRDGLWCERTKNYKHASRDPANDSS